MGNMEFSMKNSRQTSGLFGLEILRFHEDCMGLDSKFTPQKNKKIARIWDFNSVVTCGGDGLFFSDQNGRGIWIRPTSSRGCPSGIQGRSAGGDGMGIDQTGRILGLHYQNLSTSFNSRISRCFVIFDQQKKSGISR